MQYIFLMLGAASLFIGVWVATNIASDIQLILTAICILGGLCLIGIGRIIAHLNDLSNH